MKHLRLISFVTLFLLVISVPAQVFAEAVVYERNSIYVESYPYEKALANDIDREVLKSETRYLASGIRETAETAIEDGEFQHLDYTLEVDMENDNVEFLLGYVPSEETRGGNRLATVSEQVEYVQQTTGRNVVAAMNGSYFEMDTAENNGLLISNGKVLSEARFMRNRLWHLYMNFFAITNDGEAVIVDTLKRCYDKKTDTYKPVKDNEYKFAISGDAIILKHGNVTDAACVFVTYNPEDVRGQDHPRTAIGIRDDGSVVMFTTYTRISPFNYGYTNTDVALIMQEKGCHTALMLDGGGSNAYVSQYPGETEDVCRTHISEITQRSVSSGILLAAKTTENAEDLALSVCEKNGHNYKYSESTVTCTNCDFTSDTEIFSGLAQDKKSGRYSLFVNGIKKKGWTPYGTEEVYYFDERGLSCETSTLKDIPTTCTKRGYKIVQCNDASEGNRQYKLYYETQPGHNYNEKNVCLNCGHRLAYVEDCAAEFNYKKMAYTGTERIPVVTLVTPDGSELTKANGDFTVDIDNNVEIGTVNVVLEPIEYSHNYMEKRGSIAEEGTVEFQIVPGSPSKLQASRIGYNSVDLKWKASSTAGSKYDVKYEVYRKTSNGWKKIATTAKNTYVVKGLNKATSYSFRVAAVATGSDGKKYTSAAYAAKQIKTKGLAAPVLKISNVKKSGKIKLSWNKVKGADKYQIYRATAKNGKYKWLKTTKKTTMINHNAKKGITYWYKIRAVDTDNKANNSIFSNKVKRKVK